MPNAPSPLRPVFVVVGMHRSGTSLLGSMLNLLGVNIADEARPQRGNELGHFERWDIVALHEHMLEVFDRNIATLKHDFPLPSGWWSDLRLRPFTDELRRKLADLLTLGPPPGFKDPRASILLPAWRPIFAALDVEPRAFVCLRHPATVAQSLLARDGLDGEAAEYRWLRYTCEALRNTADMKRLMIVYEDWFDEARQAAQIDRLIAFAGVGPAAATADVRQGLADLVREDMNRSASAGRTRVQPATRLLHQIATDLARSDDAPARARADRFDATFSAFQRSLGGFEHAFARALSLPAAEIARKLAEAEGEAEALRREIAGRGEGE